MKKIATLDHQEVFIKYGGERRTSRAGLGGITG